MAEMMPLPQCSGRPRRVFTDGRIPGRPRPPKRHRRKTSDTTQHDDFFSEHVSEESRGQEVEKKKKSSGAAACRGPLSVAACSLYYQPSPEEAGWQLRD
eukprot:superscaffoldBa00006694_g21807